jgi:hypothetical protein
MGSNATHTPDQIFYFDEKGNLRRHDYKVEVIGVDGPAAHYTEDHKAFDGLAVGTKRRVYPIRPDE